eukprot:4997805-Amphidinium_carterae.2
MGVVWGLLGKIKLLLNLRTWYKLHPFDREQLILHWQSCQSIRPTPGESFILKGSPRDRCLQ